MNSTPPQRKTIPPPTRVTLPASQASTSKVVFGKMPNAIGQKVLIYGTGGIGKSMLGCMAPGPVAYLDAENRLGSLKSELTELSIPHPAMIPANDFPSLRSVIQSGGWDGIKSIVLDSGTVIEEWCIKHVLNTVKTFEKPPQRATSIEDYGFGKDGRIVFEAFLPIIGDLDRHAREGRNIFIICHDCKPEESNPMGANYVRFEPRLRTSKKGDNSIRLRLKEWCDFVCFICYDLATGKDKRGEDTKKAVGGGTRTMYLQETPAYMAKNHGHPDSIDLVYGVSPWPELIK